MKRNQFIVFIISFILVSIFPLKAFCSGEGEDMRGLPSSNQRAPSNRAFSLTGQGQSSGWNDFVRNQIQQAVQADRERALQAQRQRAAAIAAQAASRSQIQEADRDLQSILDSNRTGFARLSQQEIAQISTYLSHLRTEGVTLTQAQLQIMRVNSASIAQQGVARYLGRTVAQVNHPLFMRVGQSETSAEDVCGICQDSLSTQSSVQVSCNHQFHEACIQMWYYGNAQMHDSCPACRQKMVSVSRSSKVSDRNDKNPPSGGNSGSGSSGSSNAGNASNAASAR